MDYNDYLRNCLNCGHSCGIDDTKYCSFKSITHPTKLSDLSCCPKKKVTDPLQNETKEQLIIFLRNSQYTIDNLRKRLKTLTGCGDFGNVDGTVGSCVECSYDNPELFEKCWKFKYPKEKTE